MRYKVFKLNCGSRQPLKTIATHAEIWTHKQLYNYRKSLKDYWIVKVISGEESDMLRIGDLFNC